VPARAVPVDWSALLRGVQERPHEGMSDAFE
jgi:hypothetical protein